MKTGIQSMMLITVTLVLCGVRGDTADGPMPDLGLQSSRLMELTQAGGPLRNRTESRNRMLDLLKTVDRAKGNEKYSLDEIADFLLSSCYKRMASNDHFRIRDEFVRQIIWGPNVMKVDSMSVIAGECSPRKISLYLRAASFEDGLDRSLIVTREALDHFNRTIADLLEPGKIR